MSNRLSGLPIWLLYVLLAVNFSVVLFFLNPAVSVLTTVLHYVIFLLRIRHRITQQSSPEFTFPGPIARGGMIYACLLLLWIPSAVIHNIQRLRSCLNEHTTIFAGES